MELDKLQTIPPRIFDEDSFHRRIGFIIAKRDPMLRESALEFLYISYRKRRMRLLRRRKFLLYADVQLLTPALEPATTALG